MITQTPFVLLDDARTEGAGDARLFREPETIIVARTMDEVQPALDRIEALSKQGLHLAGYMAYEAGLALEPKLADLAPKPAASGPLAWFGAFRTCAVITAADVPRWLAEHGGSGAPRIGPLDPAISQGCYHNAFERLHSAISAGDIYQANLTFPLDGPWSGDPLALYAAIRSAAAAPYGGVIFDGSEWTLSFSPELFFSLEGRQARTRPMKGTRPRGRDAAEDARLRADLAASPKDRAENLMIVDLLRNDLSRVALAGSVRVESPFAIETYPTVHQMVTDISATLPEDRGAVSLLRALFPCGSITGAPKIRAMELIAEVEQTQRSVYCGTVGHIEPSGDATFNVAIRTLRLTGGDHRPRQAVMGVGSAIVADSEALSEWRECLIKGGFVRKPGNGAPACFDLIETMRFSPEEGIPLLEHHFRRIEGSAAELGFAFDRHTIRNAIQALCLDAEKPAKLRLVAAQSGAYTIELARLPDPLPDPVNVAIMRLPVDSGDWRLRHKTSDRQFYDAARELAASAGAHEVIFLRDDGLLTEGTFTNLFIERDGMLLTPPAELGLLPGVLRADLIEQGKAQEAELTLDDLSGGFMVGNALRGLLPARLLA